MKTVSIAFFLLISGFSEAATDQAAISLDKVMTKESQEAVGVPSMSTSQKGALLQALLNAFALGLKEGKADSATGFRQPSRSVIESQIDGEFEGWEGKTIVKLVNGQIWQQSEYHYEYHYAFMPDVLVIPVDNGFEMKVEDMDEAIGVTRLK